MRKILSVLAALLIAMFLFGSVAFAWTLRTYVQPDYNVEIEYYANTDDMFFYLLRDKDYNLIAVGLENKGCFVYGEWDLETGGVKQALNEYGEEYVVGVDPAPASSKLYPIPDIAYEAREKRVAEFEAANQHEEIVIPEDGITFEEYTALKDKAEQEKVDFSLDYIEENKGTVFAMRAMAVQEEEAPEDLFEAREGYPLHPVLPLVRDENTGTNHKTQPVVMIYISFEGDVDSLDRPLIFTDETRTTPSIPLHPSYINDMTFSSTQWRPYIDYRFVGPADNPLSADVLSYTYLANSKETNRATILSTVLGDNLNNQDVFSPVPTLATNTTAFNNGIYHGSLAHMINYTTKQRQAVKPGLDFSGRGGVVQVVLPKRFAQPYDTGNVGQTIGRPNGAHNNSAANTALRNEALRQLANNMDIRQVPGVTLSGTTWTVPMSALSIGSILTGYSYELSAERCILNELVGVWGNSASGTFSVTAANLPAWYDGASVSFTSIYQMCSHALDESRALPGNNPNNVSVPRLTGIWPSRPRQHVVYTHEYSHNALGTSVNQHSDTYDTSGQTRNQSAATLWPIFLSGDVITGGRIVIASRDSSLTDDETARNDTRNWFPGTRYAAFGSNWQTQGVGGYIGADDEDVAARGGAHDGWNLIERTRVLAPRTLRQTTNNVRLEYGDVIRILVAPPLSGNDFFGTSTGGTVTAINNQAFYLHVRENAGYDKGVFDWARTHLNALGADTTFEGNQTGANRYSVRSGSLTQAQLTAMGIGATDTAFHDAKGGLLISHLDVLYSQSSGTGNNPSATYGAPFVTVEAHAYPSGIYTSGDALPTTYGVGAYPFSGKYPDINRVALDPAFSAELATFTGRIRTSIPETQHLLERYMVDRARGEYVSDDVRFNMGEPSDLFNQWGVNEFVNPRLYSGDSRVQFGTNPPAGVPDTGTSLIMARSADIVRVMDRQRHPTGPVAPFAIRNIRYFDKTMPGYTDPNGNGRSYVMFDFEITEPPTLTLSSTDTVLLMGATRSLTATVLPTTYPGDRTIVWSSNNTAVATVDAGVVTPVSAGFAIIRAALSADPTVFEDCYVKVPVRATSITLTPTAAFSLNIGESREFNVTTFLPATLEAEYRRVTYNNSSPTVVSMTLSGDTGCVVTALTAGTATITATAVYRDTTLAATAVSRVVTVNAPATGVTISPTAVSLLVGGTQTLSAAVIPSNAVQTVTWSSSNPAVATVNATTGVVTAVSLGTTTITATATVGGLTANRNVAVLNQIAATQVTTAERASIHTEVEKISGDVGDVTDLTLVDPNSLIGALLYGAAYDSLSRGNGGITPTEYPFPVTSNATNQNEGMRKSAKSAWVEQLSKNLGFPVVVRRQPDKYVYAEFGDPDAPEMVMALSHLDSPTGSVNAAQLPRWRGPDGLIGPASAYHPNQYKTPYIKDGWLYGAGVQDDSGPTLATLLAAKALMEAGLPLDRRIRIVMGLYEDGGPGTPSLANTLNFMNIPLYTANPGFYDNWAYKALNREEMPIAGYTSDSRFPVIVGNSQGPNRSVEMDLSSDSTKEFRLIAATASITARSGDETLKDIVYGSATQIASNAVFTLIVYPTSQAAFIADLNAAATAQGWSIVDGAELAKVKIGVSGDNVTITINTDVAMEYPAPMYGRNAIVWGMHLISTALDSQGITSADLQLKKAAEGIADLFFRNGVEGEAYLGKNMGIPAALLRNTDNGAPNLTFAFFGGVNTENPMSFFTASTGSLLIPMQIRSMHTNAADYNTASAAVTAAWTGKGFTIQAAPAFGHPTLYLSHNNPLTALQFASYRATMQNDPAAFDDVYHLFDVAYPQGTTGGTLAGQYFNKMTAFGAIIPGNERWWHTANERITTKSIVQMTKLMADGMLEMARYSGAAGAKLMWADIPGLNPDRADLDLLDVTIGTYKDAKSVITAGNLGGATLLGATSFDIPMFRQRGNSSLNHTQIEAGHNPNAPGISGAGTQIYLDPSTITADTYVLPMRLEFKVSQPAGMSNATWDAILLSDVKKLAPLLSFNLLNGSTVVPLTLSAEDDPEMFYYKRVSQYDTNTLYISVNLAIKDDVDATVSKVIADSKTDLYSLNPAYTGTDPFPERSVKTQRGFFVFGDGAKNARFASPSAIFVALSDIGVSLDESNITLNVGDTALLLATVVPDTAPNKNVLWTSSNTSVATILGTGPLAANGIVTAVAPGTSTITVTTIDGGKTATCIVNVVQPVTGVTVSPNTASITVGGTEQLTETVTPANASDPSVTWSSSAPSVATVDATGLVTTLTVGTAVITVETVDGSFTDICTITVTPVPPTPVTGVTVSPTTVLLAVNATEQLTAIVDPASASNKSVTWSSNNPTVATVSTAGLVTAASAGTATITVRTVDGGFTDTCDVTVAVIPTITTTSLPNGTEGSAYNQTLAATGSTPITWDVSVGALPAGLTLSTAGAISGTPTTSGSADVTVRATNAVGNATRVLRITIDPAVTVTPPTITTATLPNGTVGTAYSGTLVASGSTPISWDISSGSLPDGLALSAGGAITGTPTVAGTFNFTVRANNAAGSDTSPLSIEVESVAPAPVTGVTVSPKSVTIEVGATYALTATVEPSNADNPNVTWSSNNATVADVSTTGLVTAVSAGTVTITVTTVDGGFDDTCTITVLPTIDPVDPTYPSDLTDVADKTGIDAGDLETKDNKVYLKKNVAEEIAKSLLGLDSVSTTVQPVFEGTVAPDGQVAQLTFPMLGKDLLALYADEINLIGLISGASGKRLSYTDNPADFSDGKFTLLSGGSLFSGEIDPNATYQLVAFIKDGGEFDLDGAVDGEFISTVFIASEKSGSSGGGCSAYGYLAFTMFAIPFVLRRKQ